MSQQEEIGAVAEAEVPHVNPEEVGQVGDDAQIHSEGEIIGDDPAVLDDEIEE